VQIKESQVVGRGHGLARRLAPLIDREWLDWLPTYAYAIEHPEGVILVDTGASPGLMRLPRWHPYFRLAARFNVEPEQEAAPQLKALGIAAGDVKRIVLTHLHIDHDGGLAGFPQSEVLVAPGELRMATGFAGQLRGYLPQRWPKTFDPKPLALESRAFGPFARSRFLTADRTVIAIATPGHTGDHLSVIVEDGDAALFIAGDASYSEETLLGGAVDGVSVDESAASATLVAIQAFAASRPTLYLPAHDPDAPRRLAERRTVAVASQSMTACAACSPLAATGAALGDRISASSGKAQSETRVISKKSFE
jgi:glyoxylase-like metal-dependent hydrolase (beta-lactamase superfamily II)